MPDATTLLAQVRQGLPSLPGEALDPEHNTGRLTVDVASARFRVRTAGFATQWLPDTPGNRHLAVVWFRLLVDERGRPWFTLQDLAPVVASTNRQAASQHLEDFRQCGEDMRAFVLRQRKVDATVKEHHPFFLTFVSTVIYRMTTFPRLAADACRDWCRIC